MNSKLITILGPTATGKTRFAALLANSIDAEIISADSRQIYRRMDVGTGKDYDDYVVDNISIPHHLVDIHEPGYKYNVFEFQKDFIAAYSGITNRGRKAILCGGTGMYIDAVTRSYKMVQVPENKTLRERLANKTMPELTEILSAYKTLHNVSDIDTKKRVIRAIEIEAYSIKNPQKHSEIPDLENIYLGIDVSREIRRERITRRLHTRLQEGMIEEVQALLDEGIAAENLIYYGLEYKFITLYLQEELDYNTMVSKLNTAIHQFAKRQMTWFRKMEREGCKIHWIDGTIPENEKIQKAVSLLDSENFI